MKELRLRYVFDSCLPELEKCKEDELDDIDEYVFVIRLLYHWEKIGYEIIKLHDSKAYQLNYGIVIAHLTIKQLYDLCLKYSWIVACVLDGDSIKKLRSKL